MRQHPPTCKPHQPSPECTSFNRGMRLHCTHRNKSTQDADRTLVDATKLRSVTCWRGARRHAEMRRVHSSPATGLQPNVSSCAREEHREGLRTSPHFLGGRARIAHTIRSACSCAEQLTRVAKVSSPCGPLPVTEVSCVARHSRDIKCMSFRPRHHREHTAESSGCWVLAQLRPVPINSVEMRICSVTASLGLTPQLPRLHFPFSER